MKKSRVLKIVSAVFLAFILTFSFAAVSFAETEKPAEASYSQTPETTSVQSASPTSSPTSGETQPQESPEEETASTGQTPSATARGTSTATATSKATSTAKGSGTAKISSSPKNTTPAKKTPTPVISTRTPIPTPSPTLAPISKPKVSGNDIIDEQDESEDNPDSTAVPGGVTDTHGNTAKDTEAVSGDEEFSYSDIFAALKYVFIVLAVLAFVCFGYRLFIYLKQRNSGKK